MGDEETDVPGEVLVVGTTGLFVVGAFALIGFVVDDDVLGPPVGAAAELPLGAEPTLGPGMF